MDAVRKLIGPLLSDIQTEFNKIEQTLVDGIPRLADLEQAFTTINQDVSDVDSDFSMVFTGLTNLSSQLQSYEKQLSQALPDLRSGLNNTPCVKALAQL